jgi:hypothetical protein
MHTYIYIYTHTLTYKLKNDDHKDFKESFDGLYIAECQTFTLIILLVFIGI